jgi:glycosyltransferase involved in cell wall biosynthesis
MPLQERRNLSTKRPQVIVAQLGARLHYAVPVLLQQAGMLAHFYTDFYLKAGRPRRFWQNVPGLVPPAWQTTMLNRLLGRHHSSLLSEKITAFNLLGLRFGGALSLSATLLERRQIWHKYAGKFCDLILHGNSFAGDAVYATPGVAVPLFLQGGSLGMMNIFEQFGAPEGLHYQLSNEENARWPGWESPCVPPHLVEARQKMEAQEWALADVILSPSPFVSQGLIAAGVLPEKIRLVPYGIEFSRFAAACGPGEGHQPLRVLFAGEVTLPKGPQYLFQAFELLNSSQVAARLVGPMTIQEPYCSRLKQNMELWGQVPRADMPRHYAWGDVLVFPTLCDSFGQVQVEALAAGLPVIATPHAGAVVRDGVDGFVVPVRDPMAIAEKIDQLARDRDLLRWMSENARQRSRDFSLEKYGERLIGCISSAYAKNNVSSAN